MNNRDLHFLMRVVDRNSAGQNPVSPQAGEQAAADRLERYGFIHRDKTVTTKPYAYCPLDKGWATANAMIGVMSSIADLECSEVKLREKADTIIDRAEKETKKLDPDLEAIGGVWSQAAEDLYSAICEVS